jgi:hypothetical protein
VTQQFTITYDYLCPFARIANESVLLGIETGRDWDATFHPFSLAEVHIEEGKASVWDRPLGAEGTRGVRAHVWSIAVRELAPERFPSFHLEVFSARHDAGADIDDEEVLGDVAVVAGLDIALVTDLIATGDPMARLAEAHTTAVKRWSVFGVPTFMAGDEAVFVRLMERRRVEDVDRVLDMLDWTRLNEFKRTTVPR